MLTAQGQCALLPVSPHPEPGPQNTQNSTGPKCPAIISRNNCKMEAALDEDLERVKSTGSLSCDEPVDVQLLLDEAEPLMATFMRRDNVHTVIAGYLNLRGVVSITFGGEELAWEETFDSAEVEDGARLSVRELLHAITIGDLVEVKFSKGGSHWEINRAYPGKILTCLIVVPCTPNHHQGEVKYCALYSLSSSR